MQRVYNLFLNRTNAETTALIPEINKSAFEEVVLHSESEQEPLETSHLFLSQQLAHCIEEVNAAIQNSQSYKEQVETFYCYEVIKFSTSLTLSLAASGISLTVMLMIHSQLASLLQVLISPLIDKATRIKEKMDELIKQYTYLSDKDAIMKQNNINMCRRNYMDIDFDSLTEEELDCFLIKDSDGHGRLIPIPYTYKDNIAYKDYCWTEQNYPFANKNCITYFHQYCQKQPQLFNCIKEVINKRGENENQLQALDRNITLYQEQINRVEENKTAIVDATTTWNYPSIYAFLGLSSLGVMLTSYFYYRFRSAQKKCSDEVCKPHHLDYFFEDKDKLKQIQEMCLKLNISPELPVKNILQLLKQKSKQLYQKQISRLYFLSSEAGQTLNRDVAQKILEEADLMKKENQELSSYLSPK